MRHRHDISQAPTAARSLLLQRQAALRAFLHDAVSAAVHSADEPAHLYDFKELAEDEQAQTVQAQAVVRAARELADVAAALQRIDDGSYGQCAGCGKTIAPARLHALPAVALCTRCQAESEHARPGRP